MRVPPTAGPSVVSWIATAARSCTAASFTITSSSWPSCSASWSGVTARFKWRGRSLLRPLIEPADHLLIPAHRVDRLQHPVVLVGEDHELRGHALPLQRGVHAEPLLERHAVVQLAVDH